jgi:7,8-dihydropterin-6-yl-methyl-4-(beta-D-ribofuranosyl)aminobenzene 5'-phosphate synthase
LKVTILNDNAPGRNCLAEYGLSFLVEADKKILFDTGATDVYLQNADRLGISLNDIDSIVLSHGHWDHGNGLKYISDKQLICHPEVFSKRYNKKENRYIGLNQTRTEIDARFKVATYREPYQISPQIFFLGEIPRNNNFEAKSTYFYFEGGEEDFVPDDSGLAVITASGLVVISGCAHAGICNTIEHAKKITGISSVSAVIGGFHLRTNNEQTRKTIEYFKASGIKDIYPTHCTGLPALTQFYNAFEIYQALTGDYFNFK